MGQAHNDVAKQSQPDENQDLTMLAPTSVGAKN